MAPDPDRERSRALLRDCLEDPQAGARRLPQLLSLLEAEDPSLRVSAAWACCLVAVEAEADLVDYLADRLSDRLPDATPEAALALEYLAARHPERVADRVAAAESDTTSPSIPEAGQLTRNRYRDTGPQEPSRARLPTGGGDDPRRVYDDSGADSEGHEPDAGAGEGDTAEEADTASAEPDTGDGSGDADDEDAGTAEGTEEAGAETLQRSQVLAAVAARSRFDKLHIVGAQSRGRYADTYQALLSRDGAEWAVGLRLLRQPDALEDRPAFEERVRERLADWSAVSDHEGVVETLDWGVDPQPWLATAFTGATLAGRDRLQPEEALAEARALAGALSHLHGQGVVHGGIDPRNVAYPGRLLDEEGMRLPQLDNVGLMTVFRYHFDPALCLSPRYAAPEYFDDRFGRIDHGTDIYGLGAVVFRLFTGRPPYAGGFRSVREAVLEGDPPRPSAAVGPDVEVPPAVDEVVTKAMATQKLTRYETVEHMQRELAGIDG